MAPFSRSALVGHLPAIGPVFAFVKYDGTRLSITGVEGPKADGNCRGGCGQISLSTEVQAAPGVDLPRLRRAWEEWHLNDMRAGSPAQQAHLKAHPITDRLNYYDAACASLAAAGLNPDPGHLIDGKPYRYGSRWLAEPVPEDVLQFLAALPDNTADLQTILDDCPKPPKRRSTLADECHDLADRINNED